MLATGGNTAGVKGYLRRAEEAALTIARSSSKQRGDLADGIWRLMQDAAIRASTQASVTFPMPVEGLDGKWLLAIAIPKDEPSTAFFVKGLATWTGSELRIVANRASAPLVLGGSPAALEGFNPAVLPKVIVSAHRSAIVALAAGVTACVVAFVDQPPLDALEIERVFFGLSMNEHTGEVYLMQGSD
jgi:hypothetical protein